MRKVMIDIIGGSSFIGFHVIKRLIDQNINFNILDIEKPKNDNVSYKYADVRNYNSLLQSMENESIIINLAAVHRDDVSPISLYYETNVDGAENICKAAEDKSIENIIFTSSVAVYGESNQILSENAVPNPMNPYGESKFQAEQIFIAWQKKDPSRRTLTIVRPTVVFGPSNRGNFYNLVNQIFQKKFLMIGGGENKKSIAYVENLADFIVHALRFKSGIHIYNYVDKPDLSMSELVQLIYRSIGICSPRILSIPYSMGYLVATMFDISAAVLNRKLPISRVRVRKFCSNSIFSTNAINSGFKPRFSLTDAVEKTVKYEYDNFIKKNK
jgi:nucleoside-diphosphate-sugar epimerase